MRLKSSTVHACIYKEHTFNVIELQCTITFRWAVLLLHYDIAIQVSDTYTKVQDCISNLKYAFPIYSCCNVTKSNTLHIRNMYTITRKQRHR